MINLHTKLLEIVPSVITPDEFFILLCITKRIGKKNHSWPSVRTLMQESGFGKNKVTECTNTLVAKNLVEKVQRVSDKGRFSSNLYRIKVQGIGVYIPAFGEELESLDNESTDSTVPENSDTVNQTNPDKISIPSVPDLPCTDNPNADNQTISISKNCEVLEKIFEEGKNENKFSEKKENEQIPISKLAQNPILVTHQEPNPHPNVKPLPSAPGAEFIPTQINPMSFPNRASFEREVRTYHMSGKRCTQGEINDRVLEKWGEKVDPPPPLDDGINRDPQALERLKETNYPLYEKIKQSI